MTTNSIRKSLIPMFALVVLGWFWFAYSSHGYWKRSAGVALSGTHRPYVLAGLQIPLDRYLVPSFHRESGSLYYLVFLSSDSCPHSEEQAARLSAWIESAPEVPPAVLLTFDGVRVQRRLVAALVARGVRFQQLTVGRQVAFSEDTGLAWTPAVLLLDQGLRVRLVAEALSPTVEAHLNELVAQKGTYGSGL